MPPATLQGTTIGVYAGTTITLATPLTVRETDTLFVVLDLATSSTLALPDGWAILYQHAFATTTRTLYLLRRIVSDDEPSSHVFTVAAALVPNPLLICTAYRGMSLADQVLIDAQVRDIAVSNDFSAPAASSEISALHLYVWLAADPLGTAPVAVLAGGMFLLAVAHGPYGVGSGGTLYFVEFAAICATATPVQTATSGIAQSGFVATIALRTNPIVVAPYVMPDVQGAIGFVEIGV